MLHSLEFYLFVTVTGAFWVGARKLLTVNKKLAIGAFAFIVLLWGFVLFQELKVLSFHSLAKEYIHEETTIQQMTINVVEGESNKVVRSIDVSDSDTIQKILENLSEIKMQKPQKEQQIEYEYLLHFLVSNPKGNMMETTSVTYGVGQNHFDDYKIINDVDHLKTVKEVIEGQ